jgi:DNA-binding phage protein
MTLPIYELKISNNLSDESEVSFVALVDEPAIKKDFIAFKDEFINPNKNEKRDEFLQRCIKYVIDEGKDSEQAVAICNSMWEQHFAENKISFDFDDTLSTKRGKDLAIKLIAEGNVVYIISARNDVAGMIDVAKEVGIPESRIYATGSNNAKVEKIKDLGINKHYDNNADVISQLGSVGQKFSFEMFTIVNEEQKIISGALMLADELIYRNNEKFGEHYVKFSAQTIKDIVIKLSKKKFQNRVNLMHDPEQIVKGVTMFEIWLVDKKRGIQPMKGFEEVADGSAFASYYVENEEVWNKIKKGELRGFSVEGLFDYELPLTAEENALKTIEKLLNEIITD